MRSKNISASSTGETCFATISSSKSVAGAYASRSSVIRSASTRFGNFGVLKPRQAAIIEQPQSST